MTINIHNKAEHEANQKAVSPLSRLWDMGMDLNPGRNAGRPSKPYNQVEWVWICVNIIIDVASSIQLTISDSNDKIIESGPAHDFLFNNPDLPLNKLLQETIGYYTLYREVYWITTDKELTTPKSIIVAGPEQCKPVISHGQLIGYELRDGKGHAIPLFLEDVWPITNFNPHSLFGGSSPLESGKATIGSSYQATLFNEATLNNGARIGTILTTPPGVKLDDNEKRYLKAQFESTHKGAREAGKTFLATGGMEVKTISQSMVDLQMIDLRKYDAATICALFRVPPEIVSLNSEAQYAHGPATQRFVMYTIGPLLRVIARHITQGILSGFKNKSHTGTEFEKAKSFIGNCRRIKNKQSYKVAKTQARQSSKKLFAWFDIESHPAVQEAERDKVEKVMKYIQYGIPLNQVITAYDLPFEEVPWGNDHWIGMGQVPASYILDAGSEGLTGPSLPEGQSDDENDDKSKSIDDIDILEKANETAKLRIWKNWVISWAGIEREYKDSMRIFFVRQQRDLTQKLQNAFSQDKYISKSDPDEIVARIILDLRKENGKIKVINQTFFKKASELGSRQVASELGITSDDLKDFAETVQRSKAVRHALAKQAQNIKGINKTTQAMINRTMRDGLEKGESLDDLTNRIKKTLGENRKRALRIARTQTAGAVGSGRHAGMKHAGVEKHSWLTSGDDNVRDSHKNAGTRYAKGIPINEPFVVDGDFLMYPGDPDASPGSIVNCRCVELVSKVKGKSIDYKVIEFYTYDNLKSEV